MPQYAPQQLMVTLKPGCTATDMQTLARNNGMTVVKALPVANTYLVKWTRSDSVSTKLSRVKASAKVLFASPNQYVRRFASPDDPRYPEQWHYDMIDLPAAWDLQKGQASVTVAVIDDGISVDHPDIMTRLVQGTDIAEGDGDPNYAPGDPIAGHGLHVAGTIAASTDNGIGVAGVCWEGVKIMPIKVFADFSEYSSNQLIIEGLDWAKTNGANVVNMSLGGGMYDPIMQSKITELVDAGIVVVAAAGNDTWRVGYPAAYDGVIAVSAVGPNGKIAYYSNFGPEISVAAPGGVQLYEDDPNGVLSLAWDAGVNTYAFKQGTSMACPHVAGAAALLLSAGFQPGDVKTVLEMSAKPTGLTRPNDLYGWGIIDCYAALRSGGALAAILEPSNSQKLDTTIPHFSIRLHNVEKDTIKVYVGSNIDLDADGVPDDATTPIVDSTNIDTCYDDTTGLMDFQLVQKDPLDPTQPLNYPVTPTNPILIDQPLAAGNYRVCITADSIFGQGGINTWSTFQVLPRPQPAGMRLVSIPYPLMKAAGQTEKAATQAFYGTSDFRMARWLPSVGAYAKLNYIGTINDPRGSLFPPDLDAHPHGQADATPPAGMGFWLDMGAETPLLANSFVDRSRAYDIPLIAGWNMIGDPFPFKVDWNAVMVTYQGRILTIAEAVAVGWIRPALYRYSPAGYTYESLPGGTLIPWEGNWVRCLKGSISSPVVLSVPPIVSQVVTNKAVRAPSFNLISNQSSAGKRNWSMKLAASAGSVGDDCNVIGVNAKSLDSFDSADIEAPPSPSGFVELAFVHPDWGANSGSYSSDIRSSTGSEKVWRFDVTTDLPGAKVRITWPEVGAAPADYLLTLVDCDSSTKVSLRTADSYSYYSDAKPSKRHFKLFVRRANSLRVAMNSTVGESLGGLVAIQ
jgi:subtilisin family serine protease